MRIAFGDCVFDPDTREVLRSGKAVSLPPKAFQLLEVLIRDRPKAISKENLHRLLWPDTFVSDANLAKLVAELRTALGDDARKPRIIRTVQRFGYAFPAEAHTVATSRPSSSSGAPIYRLICGSREIGLAFGENLLGRDEDSVVWIEEPSVSRRHARIVIGEKGAVLEDLGSKNGTYVRGQRIRGPVKLANEDLFSIGSASMILRIFKRPASTE
jgi:DNA-binding winged helix-turn-helix (wHTH) protein